MAFTNFYGLIDTDYIKENYVLCGQLEDSFIAPFIQTAQEKYLINVLSSGLYKDIQQQVADYLNSGTSISSTYTLLINDYLKNTLMHWTVYEMIPFLNYSVGNISIAKKSSEFSTPAELAEVTYIRNTVRSSAQFYEDRLKKHLSAEGQTTYPKLNEQYTNTDGNNSGDNNIHCGIYLGG